MSTPCTVIQFLEPNPPSAIFSEADDHSLPIEEGGVINLAQGVTAYRVDFQQEKLSDDYDFLEADISNVTDVSPLAITWDFTARDKTGFNVEFNALPDTGNYLFNWKCRVNSLTL